MLESLISEIKFLRDNPDKEKLESLIRWWPDNVAGVAAINLARAKDSLPETGGFYETDYTHFMDRAVKHLVEVWTELEPLMKRAPKQEEIKGFSAHRLEREPTEANFFNEWRKINSYATSRPLLCALVSNPTDRDCAVAATVIQWLGSHVGTGFLKDVIDNDPALKERLGIK